MGTLAAVEAQAESWKIFASPPERPAGVSFADTAWVCAPDTARGDGSASVPFSGHAPGSVPLTRPEETGRRASRSRDRAEPAKDAGSRVLCGHGLGSVPLTWPGGAS